MTEMPPVLQAALDRHQREDAPRPPVELRSSRVGRGDLRVVTPTDGSSGGVRLVLVLSVDSDHQCAEVMLVHTAPELACDIDGIVPSDKSSAPYDVVVETDLRGVVWSWQIAKAIGHLDTDVLDALGQVATGRVAADHPSPSVRTGSRLAGPLDPRWAFKKDEGGTLRRLTEDCTEVLLDEHVPWVVDPGLLRPELLDIADDPTALVSELMHWVRTRSLSITAAEVDHLLALGVLDLDAWAARGDLGADVRTALVGLIEHAATTDPAVDSDESRPWRLVTATHIEAATWSSEPEFVHYLGRKEAVPA